MGRKIKSVKTYQAILSDRLTSMEVRESFNRKEFILEVWKNYDSFIIRSFDVFFTKSKKEFPEKTFRTVKGFIHRLT